MSQLAKNGGVKGKGSSTPESDLGISQWNAADQPRRGEQDKQPDQVEEALMQLVEDGTFDELAEKYGISDLVCLGK